MYAVFRKEIADHLTSKRFIILFALVFLSAVFAIYIAIQTIRSMVDPTTEFIFLKIFTTSSSNLPSFLFFLSLFIPIVGIALGFDAVNNERNSGNLSRLMSQPIYRDSVINGKFLAGLAVLSIMIVGVVLIVAGLGLRIVGVPPTGEEVVRILGFVAISILYGGFWLALAVLFSVFFRRTATSMLASLAVWIVFFFFLSVIAGAIADGVVPVDSNSSIEDFTRNATIEGALSRISPCTLYGEATMGLLTPELGTLNPAMLIVSTYSGRMSNPLPLEESLIIVWPQIVSLIALSVICFAISYIRFMREEIRSI
ncbi:MAG: ABC transporter permease [Dehalococcoidia bacterium]|jgi:ABC-2 type transport system permease protein|nr:ABC transporter permease [Dehalococcoidia bacterium]